MRNLPSLGLAAMIAGAIAGAPGGAAPPAAPAAAAAVDYGAIAKQGDARFRDFRFRSGETIDELRIHYMTLGTPARGRDGRVTNAVMVLHGTTGSGQQFLSPQFAQELFGPGQPLDINKYYIILPDAIGHGRSSRPSDGMRMRFPRYDYEDMVEAHRRLISEELKIGRLRLIIGTSMGCMHAFTWGTRHPETIQAAMPLACLPKAIVGHNRMMRSMIIEGIKADPAWAGGDYASQPIQGLRTAASVGTIMGFAPLYQQQAYPTRESADAFVKERIGQSIAGWDANDVIYQFDASRTYDPSSGLARMTMPVTWINSQDDVINPWNYPDTEELARRMPNGRYVLIPASPETRGHGTHTWARFWKQELIDLIARSEENE